jgi:hypothetical protein
MIKLLARNNLKLIFIYIYICVCVCVCVYILVRKNDGRSKQTHFCSPLALPFPSCSFYRIKLPQFIGTSVMKEGTIWCQGEFI